MWLYLEVPSKSSHSLILILILRLCFLLSSILPKLHYKHLIQSMMPHLMVPSLVLTSHALPLFLPKLPYTHMIRCVVLFWRFHSWYWWLNLFSVFFKGCFLQGLQYQIWSNMWLKAISWFPCILPNFISKYDRLCCGSFFGIILVIFQTLRILQGLQCKLTDQICGVSFDGFIVGTAIWTPSTDSSKASFQT